MGTAVSDSDDRRGRLLDGEEEEEEEAEESDRRPGEEAGEEAGVLLLESAVVGVEGQVREEEEEGKKGRRARSGGLLGMCGSGCRLACSWYCRSVPWTDHQGVIVCCWWGGGFQGGVSWVSGMDGPRGRSVNRRAPNDTHT